MGKLVSALMIGALAFPAVAAESPQSVAAVERCMRQLARTGAIQVQQIAVVVFVTHVQASSFSRKVRLQYLRRLLAVS